MDDAHQHLAVARDLNLLPIDAERGLGNRQLLPLGELREPEHHWQRADAILLTKANLGFSDAWMHLLRQELKVDRPIFRCDYLPVRLRRLDGQEVRMSKHWLRKRFLPIVALPNPKASLKYCDLSVRAGRSFELARPSPTLVKTFSGCCGFGVKAVRSVG